MSRITQVMIVDDNRQLVESIQLYFVMRNKAKITGIASNSIEAIEMMKGTSPDIILLDLVMPHSDGFVLLSYLNNLRQENKPDVIVLSSLLNEKVIRSTCSLGAVYYMAKPFSIDDLHDRVMDIAELRERPGTRLIDSDQNADTIDQYLYTSISEYGISKEKKGYQYIYESAKLVMEHPELMRHLTKELYPIIGKMFDASPVSVERAIRFAIGDAWGGKNGTRNSDSKNQPIPMRRRPSNGKFISVLTSSILKSIEDNRNMGRGIYEHDRLH